MTNKHLLTAILILTLSTTLHSTPPSTETLLKNAENVMQGDSSHMILEMTITTPKWSRSVHIESWSKTKDFSYIHILYPPRDRDVTFLKRYNEMWQYIPKVERIIKIPPSMMMQSWMGSDFTNDDLIRETSLSDDYTATLLKTKETYYILELIPKESAPVTWGKLIMHLHKTHYIPLYQGFYDEKNNLVRILEMSNIQKLNNKWFPMTWTVTPQEKKKKGQHTTLTVKTAEFDIPLQDNLFTRRHLKNPSH